MPTGDFVELLFFAYRDFTAGGGRGAAEFGLGRAHHRVLHFVDRNPGLRVSDLLEILKITKQSLARVLKELVDQGFIVQRPASATAASACCMRPRRASTSPGASTACRRNASRRRSPTPAAAARGSPRASCST